MNEKYFAGSLFGGIKVIESRAISPVPKIQISPAFPWCTPEFRAEYNSWLLERFGRKEVAYLMSGPFGDFLAAGPLTVDTLRRAAKLVNFK